LNIIKKTYFNIFLGNFKKGYFNLIGRKN